MRDPIVVISHNQNLAGLIARILRCRQVYCQPLAYGASAEEIAALHPSGLVLAADEEDELAHWEFSMLQKGLPVLALAGAAVAVLKQFGGEASEVGGGKSAVTLSLSDNALFAEIVGGERVLHAIADFTLPEPLLPLATATERIIGFKHKALPIYALQYPIERNDPDAAQLLYNFACNICHSPADWNEDTIIDRAVNEIREASAAGQVVCAISGGVDSAVCAKLAKIALGDRLQCVFVDTGLFRQGEPQNVLSTFADTLSTEVRYVDAKEAFLHALTGVSGAEDKERIVTSLMAQILLKEVHMLENAHTLILGTNLNDAQWDAPHAEVFKEAFAASELCVCEPICDLFKDEIRRLAVALHMPPALAQRRPFPTGGLSLRIMDDITAERLEVLRAADACFTEELSVDGLDKRLWQCYALLVRSPDCPSCHTVCLRALQEAQGGAHAARLPFDVLERATARILSQVHGISRVVYDLTPGTNDAEQE
ncbi:MAG: hypothetical protein RSE58_04195 [Clostridia bacterium]